MKLTTIWSIPAMSLTERLRRTADWGAQAIASSLPQRIRYWVAIQQIAGATMDSPNVPATPLESILPKLSGGPR
jgi:hypothetical protein